MSTFLPEKQVLFLHIPKTGGTWVNWAMGTMEISIEKWMRVGPKYRPRKHTILPHYYPSMLGKIHYIFCFVRHPVSYYVSMWRYYMRISSWTRERMEKLSRDLPPRATNQAEVRWKPDFYEWIEEMLEEEPGWITRWFGHYVGQQRGELCHYIGRQETLVDDFAEVMGIIGYEKLWMAKKEQLKNMKAKRTSERIVPIPEIDDDLRRRIERSERVIIRRFFGKDTSKQRIYRDFKTGYPV